MNAIPVLGLALMVAAPVPKEGKKPDPPSIVGEWTCVEMTHDGDTWQPTPDSVRRVFKADGELVSHLQQTWTYYRYKIDPKKGPGTIDLVGRDGGGDPILGIYKIEKDILTLCYPAPSPPKGKKAAVGVRERPTKFEAPAGTGIMLMTLKRVEKKE